MVLHYMYYLSYILIGEGTLMQYVECTNVHGDYHILSFFFVCFFVFFTFQFDSLNHSFNLTGQRVCKKLWNCSQFQFIHALNHLQRLLKNSNSKGIFYKIENKKGTRWDGYTIHCRKQNLHMSSIVCQQRIRSLFIAPVLMKSYKRTYF